MYKRLFNKIVSKIIQRIKKSEQEDLTAAKINISNKLQSVGSNFNLNGSKWVFRKPNKIIIGNNVHIGDNAYFVADGGLVVGDNTHISRNVTIYTVNHDYENLALPYDNGLKFKNVHIDKNVWIGMNVSIVPGVHIGEGAIIGMGTVVNRNIEPFEIVGPALTSHIKYRDKKTYFHLKESQYYGGKSGKIMTPESIQGYKKTYLENKNNRIVFILSTGRSGSQSIVNILNQHPDVAAFHENFRQLIQISTKIAENSEGVDTYYAELRELLSHKVWPDEDKLIVHSDHRLWNLVPFLAEYFPNSCFIHLVRNPSDSILSMYTRNWYAPLEYPLLNPIEHAKFRLAANKIGACSNAEWDAMGPLEKCTWYYHYVNDKINNDLMSVVEERCLRIELENIEKEYTNINAFLDLDAFSYTTLVSNRRKVYHNKNLEKINRVEIQKKINDLLKKYEE